MAVAWHAVRRGEVGKKDVAIVIGCGPVGLGVILMLKAKGVRTVVASDFSPGRRALASACGADVVVDPAEESPYAAAGAATISTDIPSTLELAVGTTEKLGASRRLVARRGAWARRSARCPKHPVIFECVGVPGVIDDIIDGAPLFSRVVVVGVCVGPDQIHAGDGDQQGDRPAVRRRLHAARVPRHAAHARRRQGRPEPADHRRRSGLDGVDAAFSALGDPEAHAKILIDPRSEATSPTA